MQEYSFVKKALLRELSENARATITELAKAAKCSRTTVINNLGALEKEFGIRYTIEFNEDEMNFSQRHVLRIEFTKKPKPEFIDSVFKDDKVAQFVAWIEGQFDLFVYAITDSGRRYMKWETDLAIKLAQYRPKIRPSEIEFTQLGYFPISNELLEAITFPRFKLDETDKKMLLLLNENARIGYSDISRALKINDDTVRYRFKRIMKMGVIKRFTIAIQKPPTTYNTVLFARYRFGPGHESRASRIRNLYMDIDGPLPIMNTFQYVTPLTGTYRFFQMGCFEDEKAAQENGPGAQRKFFKEDIPTIYFGRIIKVIKGFLPYRNIDVRKNYQILKWED